MARSESEEKKQKRKGKKRKHEKAKGLESDEESAEKSLIVERKQVEPEQTKVKAQKRKLGNENADMVKEKRNKRRQSMSEEENEAENEPEMPTAEQLQEAAKPENSKAIVTVRQKKKQKHQQRIEEQKDQNANKDSNRNAEYLRKWKEARQEWKFNKLRQVSIQQTVFDDQKLSADVWPIALEYLAGSSGAAKTNITKLAEAVIEELDNQCQTLSEEAERQAILDSTRYQRARDLLQSFD
ncbi:uncharacterized protein C7orf50 homolog [Scaptodrosophila lebanonensis]|uniref:Uncharacterized protein C7orf50 homolog n=1 Tax=Drosophila lebanonensis TaxID=7225 RepID=A0A6J2UC01_DROLE|nr:uncharacterized protein C7orf50 homolog [Scaptodrosophila lebanonensis]